MPTDCEGIAAGFRDHAECQLLQIGCKCPVCQVEKSTEAQVQIEWEDVA